MIFFIDMSLRSSEVILFQFASKEKQSEHDACIAIKNKTNLKSNNIAEICDMMFDEQGNLFVLRNDPNHPLECYPSSRAPPHPLNFIKCINDIVKKDAKEFTDVAPQFKDLMRAWKAPEKRPLKETQHEKKDLNDVEMASPNKRSKPNE
ncbi:hypothetical protein RFI_11285 [Reticulomyxa filosa]|uniref:Uncharacterized protein n=1 Tax=Reticulomyxa filosa TaxID=46433 RepID=X6NKG4_RETFI|nr:hypothetical protein RFI_11285 [Reticulomyxa filosa]|eukprot:ETO25852.1 hypothetical protein RFI_11285 [Reticulomyxa filosa]